MHECRPEIFAGLSTTLRVTDTYQLDPLVTYVLLKVLLYVRVSLLEPSMAPFQESGPVLDGFIPVDAEDIPVMTESTSSSAGHAMHGMDGEDLGVELAKVAYDVKVNRQHPAALEAERITLPDICCRQAVSGVQGGDIRLLHVADLVYWTSYLVNAALCLSFITPQSRNMSFSPCIDGISERQHTGCALLLVTCRVELLHCVAVDGERFFKAPAAGGLSKDAAERAGFGAESQLRCLWKVGSHAHSTPVSVHIVFSSVATIIIAQDLYVTLRVFHSRLLLSTCCKASE